MPADKTPTLEDLARAAVEAWNNRSLSGGWQGDALFKAMMALEHHLETAEPPTRVTDYMLPARVQVEKDFACALTRIAWPESNHACQAIIDKARHLARLLLDPPAA